MKAYHKACGSSNLVPNALNEVVCNHCHRIVESYEVVKTQPIHRCISSIENNWQLRDMISKGIEKR